MAGRRVAGSRVAEAQPRSRPGRPRVRGLLHFYPGPSGRVFAQLVGEAQADPLIQQELRPNLVDSRRDLFRTSPPVLHHETASHLGTGRRGRRVGRHRGRTDGSCRAHGTDAEPSGADYLGPRCCGATLIGDLVAGVRVTPISGCFVGLGRAVGLTTTGASFIVDGSGGGGGGAGGGGGGCLLVAVAVASGVVEGGVLSAGTRSSAAGEPRNTNRTTETTIADSAAALAISRVRACEDRCHGSADTTVKSWSQVFSSNASNPSRSFGSPSASK